MDRWASNSSLCNLNHSHHNSSSLQAVHLSRSNLVDHQRNSQAGLLANPKVSNQAALQDNSLADRLVNSLVSHQASSLVDLPLNQVSLADHSNLAQHQVNQEVLHPKDHLQVLSHQVQDPRLGHNSHQQLQHDHQLPHLSHLRLHLKGRQRPRPSRLARHRDLP